MNALLSILFATLAVTGMAAPAHAISQSGLGEQLGITAKAIEQRVGGRLGVSVIDVATGQTWAYRGDDRFPMASTFKAFTCAHLLYQADQGTLNLNDRVPFSASELDSYSPVTHDRAGAPGMTLRELCDAATSMSDNTATNLVLKATGGPQALTAFLRTLGDKHTRSDRYEPDMSNVAPGDARDTTTPNAAAATLKTLVLGQPLLPRSRLQLMTWLLDNKVSADLFRASLPSGWTIADRTGAAEYGSRGIIAVIWPKGPGVTSGPIVAAAYLTGTSLTLEARNAVMAEVGAALVKDLTRQ